MFSSSCNPNTQIVPSLYLTIHKYFLMIVMIYGKEEKEDICFVVERVHFLSIILFNS